MRLRSPFSSRLLTFILLGVFAWPLLAWAAGEALIVRAPLANADVIVVLSGSSAYVERTTRAAELFREGRAPLLVLTDDHTQGGWSNALQRNPYFVERATDELIREGVPSGRIRVVPGGASSTHAEASILKQYAVTQGIRSILVVTSAYHSRRALRSLRQSFAGTGTTIGMEPVPPGSETPSTAFWWLRSEGWRNVGGEYVKLIYYWFKYDS